MISDYISLKFILIIPCLIEIFAISVFIEIIELNFCSLNINLKKNIIFRAGSEIISLNKTIDEDSSTESVYNLNEEQNENSDDNNSMY